LFAVQVFREVDIDKLPGFRKRLAWFLENKPRLAAHIGIRDGSDAYYRRIALLAVQPCTVSSVYFGTCLTKTNSCPTTGCGRYHLYYGDDLKVECPTGSGRMLNLLEVSHELARRLLSIFLKDASGRRPVHGQADVYAQSPTWQNLVLLYEYFHGDSGRGVGGQSPDRVDGAGGEVAGKTCAGAIADNNVFCFSRILAVVGFSYR
jgi:hypothetical protein